MVDFLAALGLALVIEGVIYALAPEQMKAMMARVLEEPAPRLRYGGLALAFVGLGIVWLARG